MLPRATPPPATRSCSARGISLFALLSVADLALTWRLLLDSGGDVYEGNPVARRLLAAYGWAGLVAFKAALVLLTAALCLAIARRRPRTAGRLLAFACAIVAAVVVYGCGLSVWNYRLRAALTAEGQRLEDSLRQAAEYRALVQRLGDDLVRRRCSLAEAVDILARSARGGNADWLDRLREHHGHLTDQACLAANVIHMAVLARLASPHQARAAARRLEAAFRAEFKIPPPRRYATLLAAAGKKGPNGRIGPTRTESP